MGDHGKKAPAGLRKLELEIGYGAKVDAGAVLVSLLKSRDLKNEKLTIWKNDIAPAGAA